MRIGFKNFRRLVILIGVTGFQLGCKTAGNSGSASEFKAAADGGHSTTEILSCKSEVQNPRSGDWWPSPQLNVFADTINKTSPAVILSSMIDPRTKKRYPTLPLLPLQFIIATT